MTTRMSDPRVVVQQIRHKHAATIAAIRTALGTRATPEAADLLDGLVALLSVPSTANDHVGYLLESNVTAARARRQQAETAAAATKPARRTPIGGLQ